MDWNAIKNKGAAFKDRVVDFGGKAVDKTMTALEKTASHSYDGLKKTPVSIKNGAEFDEAKNLQTTVVIFVLGKEDPVSRAVLVRMPLLVKDAWIYSATLKVVLAPEVPELLPVLPVSEAPGMLIFRKGELEKTLTGDAVLEFAKNFDLSKKKEEAPAAPEGMVDPLAAASAVPKTPEPAVTPVATETAAPAVPPSEAAQPEAPVAEPAPVTVPEAPKPAA